MEEAEESRECYSGNSLMQQSEKYDVQRWFRARFGKPTPAQKAAWPLIRQRKNVLIASPTGTGKTLAAFLGVLDHLEHLRENGQLLETIYCIYVSPLRALAYDLEKNLAEPLREIYGGDAPIRVGLRSGDTSSHERVRQFDRPPHILLTTPESLCLLLSQKKWLPQLENVRWAIVDEIHAMAENKRGAHLSVSLSRLERLTPGVRPSRVQRIGLSATVAPLGEVGKFLTGTHGKCEIVDASSNKQIELKVHTPLRKRPYPEAGYTGQRLIRELAATVRKYRTTLVFTNTRSGAEAATFWLREAAPDLAEEIECHHASLERDVRQEVEDRLKRGELRAVICSTSLELGIDIGSIDAVVMLSTPKGVSRTLQRAGRSGHNIHSVSRGILMATNVNDLVEACATVLLSRRMQLDPVRLPEAPLDVLAQHLVSMGCTGRWRRDEALEVVRSAYPFAKLTRHDFDEVLDYLAGGGKALRAAYTEVFGKIELDDEGFRTRPGRVQQDFLQNVGVIPNVGVVQVRTRQKHLGSVEESFINRLSPGDVMIMSGRPFRLERVNTMEAFVEPAPGALPTVPRWNANKMPLSTNLAEEIVRFRGEVRKRIAGKRFQPEQAAAWVAGRLDCGLANGRIVLEMFLGQSRVSEIPRAGELLVERFDDLAEAQRHYFFHTVLGRAANEALVRVLTLRLSRRRGGSAVATTNDYGFVLSVGLDQHIDADELPALLAPENFLADFHASLAHSEMLKHHFRNAAQIGLMVYRNYFGKRKPTRKLHWSAEVIYNVLREHEPDHVLLREARRDCLHVFLDAETAWRYLQEAVGAPVKFRSVTKVPPLSFALYATKIKEALQVEDPAETMERLFNQWWNEIDGGTRAA